MIELLLSVFIIILVNDDLSENYLNILKKLKIVVDFLTLVAEIAYLYTFNSTNLNLKFTIICMSVI